VNDKTADYWWGYMFSACGEGTCGGMGQAQTHDAAWAEIQYWANDDAYSCWIVRDGETVYEKEATA
jgi:hypothetical protein